MNTLNRHIYRGMKRLFLSLGLFMGLHGNAQLAIENYNLPDTLTLFSQVSVQFSVKNVGNSSRVGNLQLMFLNASNDSITLPLGSFNNTLQFFAPQQTRGFEVPIDVTPDFFIDGGNTVVIWPSMAANPDEINSIIVDTVYILGSNTSSSSIPQFDELQLIENPVTKQLLFNMMPPAGSEITIFDSSGRMLQQGILNQSFFTLNSTQMGLYLAVIRNKGQVVRQLRFICQ